MSSSGSEAARLLASLGYETAWYSPSPDQEYTYDIDLTANEYRPPTVDQIYTTQPFTPTVTAPLVSAAPSGTQVDFWGDIKDWFSGYKDNVTDNIQDPFGPIDDIIRFPGNLFGGAQNLIEGAKGLMNPLMLMMMMGGKMDFKKILLMLLATGGLGGLSGIFGGLGNIFGASSGAKAVSFDQPSGGIDPMMLMMMMGGGGSNNKMLQTMIMAPMLGIDPGAAMMLGQFTNTGSGRRSYRRRGYSAASRRSYSAGLQRGQMAALRA